MKKILFAVLVGLLLNGCSSGKSEDKTLSLLIKAYEADSAFNEQEGYKKAFTLDDDMKAMFMFFLGATESSCDESQIETKIHSTFSENKNVEEIVMQEFPLAMKHLCQNNNRVSDEDANAYMMGRLHTTQTELVRIYQVEEMFQLRFPALNPKYEKNL